MTNRHAPPFPPQFALVDDDSGQHLPGEPRVSINDRHGVNTFLHRELEAPLFDELYPWCEILAPKKGDNISSLHRQRVNGREIIPSEDPRHHMVWNKYKIYVKPIPACLLSYRVWETFLSGRHTEPGEEGPEPDLVEPKNLSPEPIETSAPVLVPPSSCSPAAPRNGPPAERSDLSEHLPYPSSSSSSSPMATNYDPSVSVFDRKVALGFLRSYAYLIRHASDLKMAHDVGLLPEVETPITWTRWALFISHFQSIPDSEVSRRYHFGHLRLGRLDWAVRMRFIHSHFTSSSPTATSAAHDNIEAGHPSPGLKSITTESRTKGPRWFYLQPYWSIPVLLEGLFNYFLFAFATASLLLSAMQVALAIPPGAYLGLPGLSSVPPDSGDEEIIPGGKYILEMWRFFWVFANATIYICGFLCLGMLGLLAYPYLKKMARVALRGIWQRKRGRKGQ